MCLVSRKLAKLPISVTNSCNILVRVNGLSMFSDKNYVIYIYFCVHIFADKNCNFLIAKMKIGHQV